jgi:type VI secretion system protein ImpL
MSVVETVKDALRSKITYVVAAVVVLLLLTVVLYWLGWLQVVAASGWVRLVVSIVVAAGIFAGLRWGVPAYQEWRFLRREGSQYAVGGQESPEEFRARFAKALQTLRTLPQLKGRGDPLYGLPWYLLVGEPGSGKTQAVLGSDLFVSLIPLGSAEGGTRNCDWWVSNSALILDTAGRYAVPIEPARDRAEWYRLLRFLHHHRRQAPIDGLLIAIPADEVISAADEHLRTRANVIRERIEEAVLELGIDFPVYLLITKCDRIEGWAPFFAQLPPRTLDEVVGYVHDPTQRAADGAAPEVGGGRAVGAALDSIYARLLRFRLSMLLGRASEAMQQAAFCFPEEFATLQRGLAAVAEGLFSEDVRYHTPHFRGIFFTSARQEGTPRSALRPRLHLSETSVSQATAARHYFVRDLFDSILPRDRSLVSSTARERRKRGLGKLVRLVAVVGAFVVGSVLVVTELVTDRRIVSGAGESACPEAAARESGAPRLAELDACRLAAQSVAEKNRQRLAWGRMLFDRSGKLEESLRARYVQGFRAAVLSSLNAEMQRAFEVTQDPLPIVLVLARRIQIARRCLSPGGCPTPIGPDLQPDYAVMLDPAHKQRDLEKEAEKLGAGYSAYVLWQVQPRQELQQDLAEDQRRLQEWLAAKQLDLSQLLVWVNRRAPPMTYETYWELPAPIATIALPRIDAACTRKVWGQDVAPFLQQIQDAVPEVGPRLHAFQQGYVETCLAQWKRFLEAFPNGAASWRGPDRRRELALRLLKQDSPYRRVLDDAVANLGPWLPADEASKEGPGWAMALRRQATSPERKAYEKALDAITGKLEGKPLPEAGFELVRATFAEGKPGADSASPVLRAWWLASQPQAGAATREGEPDIVGGLLREPVLFVWRYLLEVTGEHLQKAWAENVEAPIVSLPPAEQVVLLYGPGGRLGAFAEKFTRPFLTEQGDGAATLLGEQLPFSPAFLEVMKDSTDLGVLLGGGTPPQPVVVKAARPSELEGQGSLREEQTLLTVTCAGKTYRLTDRPIDASEREATVPWSLQTCGDVTIAVYFTNSGPDAAAEASHYQLTRRYTGQKGFLYFLQEFATGSHDFALEDLEGDAAQWNVLKFLVKSIRVYYDVALPPALQRLMARLQNPVPPEIASIP